MPKFTALHQPVSVFLAGWHTVMHVLRRLAALVVLTEQDFREAGVYLGEKRE